MGPQDLICSSGYDLAKVMVSYFNKGSNSKGGAQFEWETMTVMMRNEYRFDHDG